MPSVLHTFSDRPKRLVRRSRIALAMAVLFALLTVSAGALHHHAAGSTRVDCHACSWIHSAAAGLQAAAPTLAVLTASSALPLQVPDRFVSSEFTPHAGRAPPPIA